MLVSLRPVTCGWSSSPSCFSLSTSDVLVVLTERNVKRLLKEMLKA